MENKFNITITKKAQEKIRQELNKRNTPSSGLRLGIRAFGCSGYSYVIQFEDAEPRQDDHVFNFEDLKVYVDKKSIIYLNEITLDWEFNLNCQGFKFINEKESSKCGCGLSFDLKK